MKSNGHPLLKKGPPKTLESKLQSNLNPINMNRTGISLGL